MLEGRRSNSLICALTISIGTLASCGGEPKLDVTLRSRDGFGRSSGECTFWLDGPHPARFFVEGRQTETTIRCVGTTVQRQWVAIDGRRATSPARTLPVSFSNYLTDPVECNGEQLRLEDSWFKWSIVDDSLTVQFDDGAAMVLQDEHGMAVYNGSNIICSEATGRWRGTAGPLLGRSGTYTSVYDTIQTILTLVED